MELWLECALYLPTWSSESAPALLTAQLSFTLHGSLPIYFFFLPKKKKKNQLQSILSLIKMDTHNPPNQTLYFLTL